MANADCTTQPQILDGSKDAKFLFIQQFVLAESALREYWHGKTSDNWKVRPNYRIGLAYTQIQGPRDSEVEGCRQNGLILEKDLVSTTSMQSVCFLMLFFVSNVCFND